MERAATELLQLLAVAHRNLDEARSYPPAAPPTVDGRVMGD